jgi:hypothetical protein
MGKYLSLTEECVQILKPVIEERTGTDLGEIVVKTMRTLPDHYNKDHHDQSDFYMFARKGGFIRPKVREPEAIYVNEDVYETENAPEKIPRHVNHELAHFAYHKIVEKKIKDKSSKLLSILGTRRCYRSKSFIEGFCEYLSLNYLTDLYDDQTCKEVWKNIMRNASYRNFSPEEVPYERGYKFFRKVLGVIGKDKVFEVARSPPISEIEVKIPFLYLLRRYPAQGIRNTPKFFTRNIRNIRPKILKKLHRYAFLDF